MPVAGGFCARGGRRRLRCRSAVLASTERHGAISSCGPDAFHPLGLSGRAGIDLVVGDLPRVVDVNPRPTTSIVGIAKVMRGGAGGPDPEGEVCDAAGEGDGGGGVRFYQI